MERMHVRACRRDGMVQQRVLGAERVGVGARALGLAAAGWFSSWLAGWVAVLCRASVRELGYAESAV